MQTMERLEQGTLVWLRGPGDKALRARVIGYSQSGQVVVEFYCPENGLWSSPRGVDQGADIVGDELKSRE
jgi:hypothetical protein